MASKRKSTTPCMIPLKSMHMQEEVEPEGDPPDCLLQAGKDGSSPSGEEMCEQSTQETADPLRTDRGSVPEELGTCICRPCGFESQDLNLFLDHVYSGHRDFRAEPSFHCVDCDVSTPKFEGLALHNARAHPSSLATTLQVMRRDGRITVEQSLIVGEGSKESEISITKTPIMRMLKGKSEPKRIVVSHAADDITLDYIASRDVEKKDAPAVMHVPTIVHNGAPSKVTAPSALQIASTSGTLPVLKTAITQVVSVVQNRTLHQQTPMTASMSTSSTSSRNLPKVMIPLSSIPTYNAAMDTNSFLKTSFSKFPYPTKAELCYLTVVTKYPEEQIKIWFTAQRLKQGISWSPEEIEEARRKMFNTIIQTAPPSPQPQVHSHQKPSQHTITVLPASLGPGSISQILQGSFVGQGGVIVTQPVVANGIQVSSAPVALAVTPKPQAAAKPPMQARPAAALVADKSASMAMGMAGSSSSSGTVITSSTSSSVRISNGISRNTSVISISGGISSSDSSNSKSKSNSSGNCNSNTANKCSSSNISGNGSSSSSSNGSGGCCSSSSSSSTSGGSSISSSTTSTSSSNITKVTAPLTPAPSISPSSRTLPSSLLDPSFYKNKKSQEQLSALKQSFLRNQFPVQEEVERLTKITGLSVREVRKWFSDRRYHKRNMKSSRSGAGGHLGGSSLLDPANSPSSSDSPKPNQRAQSPTQQQMSPPAPPRRAPRQQTPDFTAIRYKERDPQQVRALEASFSQDPSPSEEEVGRLRAETKMTRREIDGWFSERRKKAAAEKKKEEAEKGEEDDLLEDVDRKCTSEDPSLTSEQHVKDEKHKDEAEPKVNPIKINLKMLKVTESNGKPEPEATQTVQVERQATPPPSTSSSSSNHGKTSPDPFHLLKQFFVRNRWPNSAQHDNLSAKSGLPRAEVVRWFGDARCSFKNGQLKWLECYQQKAEEGADQPKSENTILEAHLSLHGRLEEEHVGGLVESSGLSEDQVRRWFATKEPSLLESEVAMKAEPTPQDQRATKEQLNEPTADDGVLNNDSSLATDAQAGNLPQGTD